jgi:thiol-disulfide isomerase/thioredoxin
MSAAKRGEVGTPTAPPAGRVTSPVGSMRRVGFLAVVAAALLHHAPARAGQATCSNPGLPAGALASSDLMPWRLSLALTTGLLPVTSQQVLTDAQGTLRYDTRLVLVETRLSAELALRSWLAVGVGLPYRVVNVGVTYRDPTTGEIVMPGSVAIHARDETVRGIGDPSVQVHLARDAGGFHLHARIGTSVPLGGTVEDPFVLGMIGQDHQHIQLGTGTFIPFVAAEAQRTFGRVTLAGWGLVHASLYENDHGFRAGHRISGGLTGATGFGLRDWTFSLAAEVHGETAEHWNGVVYEDESNAGRVDVMTGVAAVWRPLRDLAFVADVKVPVYSKIVGEQLDYPVVAAVGVAATFDLAGRASWRGLDHADAGPRGSDAPLVPVPGLITVFDLWADWCPPCRELDDKLESLSRAYPGRLAVRKLDVIDDESAAWKRYLEPGSYSLPHIKVYGTDGTLVFERTAPPDQLVAAIEQLLQP